jgi:hypothetical protein
MVRGVLFADSGTELADFRAQLTDPRRKGGLSSHPLGREETDIGAVSAKSDAAYHQVVAALMRHADHVICAGVADPGAGKTGLNAMV